MSEIHVECLPDETLLKKLGFSRKQITHHTGKSRVFYQLTKSKNIVAMVDEDPKSPKTSHEKTLIFIKEQDGIMIYTDQFKNRIIILEVKLEDWVIALCKKYEVNILKFGLPDKPNDLHDKINQHLPKFEKLIDSLLVKNNPALLFLKENLKQ